MLLWRHPNQNRSIAIVVQPVPGREAAADGVGLHLPGLYSVLVQKRDNPADAGIRQREIVW